MVNKISAIFLALVLCLSVMVVPVSAAAPTPTGTAKIGVGFEYLDEDGNAVTSVQPGQVITINIYATINAANQALAQGKFSVWFNDAIYEYVSSEFVGPAAYKNDASITEVVDSSAKSFTNVQSAMTEDELAYGWNSAVIMQFGLDKTVPGSYLIQENADTVFATVTMKVKDDVAVGTPAPIGAPQSSRYASRASYNYAQSSSVKGTAIGHFVLDTGAGTSFVATVPACEEHTMNNGEEVKTANCVDAGEILYTCTVCGYTETETIPATGHTLTQVEAQAPTCTEAGYEAYEYCTECDYTTHKEVAATGHSTVAVEAKAPTCTEVGYDAYEYCSNCNYTTYAEIVAKGHSYEAEVTAPTCTAEGYTTYTCSVCDDSYTADATEALGHTEADAVVENEVAADCVNAGSYDNVVYCSVCDAELSRETVTVPATGDHVYAEVVDEKAATCTEDGYVTKVCGCGERNTTVVPATGHTEAEAVVENEVAADCVNAGSYDNVVYCSVCDAEVSRETITVEALGHTAAEAVVENEVAADCVNAGSYDEVVYCSVCDEEVSRETITVDALGHTAAEAVVENEVAATCTEAGSYDNVVYCSVCDEEISRETITVEATGHNDADNDGYCDDCENLIETPEDCGHLCHKSGIRGFFWKIIKFFYRLLNIQQYCDCGELHYEKPIFNFNR